MDMSFQPDMQQTGRPTRAQKEAARLAKPVSMEALSKKIGWLLALRETAKDAASDFSEAVSAVAMEAGIESSVVKRFVNARASEAYYKKRECEQLALCFDEIGETSRVS